MDAAGAGDTGLARAVRSPRAWPRLASSVVRLGLAGLRPELAHVRASFRGYDLAADLRTPLGRQLYRYGYQHPDLDLLEALVVPGRVVVDCGANVGLFTLAACAAGARLVVAVEPATATRRVLERNLASAGVCAQVAVRSCALGAEVGTVDFTVMPGDGGLSSFAPAEPGVGTIERVEVRRLDDVVPRASWAQVCLLKIDVEGAEAKLLAGAHGIIAAARPAVLIELEDNHLERQGSSTSEVLRVLRSLDYRAAPGAEAPNHLFLAGRSTGAPQGAG